MTGARVRTGVQGPDRPRLDRDLDEEATDALPASRPPRRAGAPARPAVPGRPHAAQDPDRSWDPGDRGATVVRPARIGERPTGRGRTGTARRTLRAALGATAASMLVPGTGHLLLRRRRTGAIILALFLGALAAAAGAVLTLRRSTLIGGLVSPTVLAVGSGVAIVVALAWIAVVARTYALARPRRMPVGRRMLGTACAALMCMVVAIPFGFAADLANSQRSLLNSLFTGGKGGTAAAEAIAKPRLNVLLLGSDAGPDRTGARTDTMMLASIDTHTGRTTLFALPRNIQRAQFPPGSPMARQFPKGFFDPTDPLSGNYLLNAVYAYAHEHPQVAPAGPTEDIGLNLLQSTISYMLGLPIDYYLEVDMAGFSSLIDAVGGVTVDVGPERIPIDGVTADGRHVTPRGYIEPGIQRLDGDTALWFARSRRDGTDYQRMGRQRCLIQAVLEQKSPAELLARFQSVAAAAKDNVSTNLPQEVLPALVQLAGEGFHLESVAFDPSLPDPNQPDGQFSTSDPEPDYMREVVRNALDPPAPAAAPAPTTARTTAPTTRPADPASAGPTPAERAAPTSLAQSCAASAAAPATPSAGG